MFIDEFVLMSLLRIATRVTCLSTRSSLMPEIGLAVSVLKDKLSALGSSGIMHGHQLLHQARAQAGSLKRSSSLAGCRGTQLTMSDLARKAFLYGNSANEQVRSGPIMTLPLLTIADYSHLLRDVPVCQPLQQELKFFNSEQRIFNYPVRVFFMDACNLTSYNLTNGDYNIYKKLSTTVRLSTSGDMKVH
ncbi:hypothetical protein Mapa_007286 [Marchantia paleacea]|nr:hypothetical protein Mapa_007286 [Marchantia paleacea]